MRINEPSAPGACGPSTNVADYLRHMLASLEREGLWGADATTHIRAYMEDQIEIAASALPLIEAICSHRACARRGTYDVRGHCSNCGTDFRLRLTQGHTKPLGMSSGVECLVCGCRGVAGKELLSTSAPKAAGDQTEPEAESIKEEGVLPAGAFPGSGR